MNTARPFVIAVGLILGGQLAFAQDMSRYRAYFRSPTCPLCQLGGKP